MSNKLKDEDIQDFDYHRKILRFRQMVKDQPVVPHVLAARFGVSDMLESIIKNSTFSEAPYDYEGSALADKWKAGQCALIYATTNPTAFVIVPVH